MRNYYRVGRGKLTRRLLPDGSALHGQSVRTLRGDRTLISYAEALGVTERTVRRWQQNGASLTHALAMVGLELETGDLRRAAWALDMIGSTRRLRPTWEPDPMTHNGKGIRCEP